MLGTRRRQVAGVLLVAATLVGCGGSDSGATSSFLSSTTTDPDRAIEQEAPEPIGLQPSGTELADGFSVPEGASLAGSIFWSPNPDPSVDSGAQGPDLPDSWTAQLVVDGDPFAAWDDLAAQARDRAEPLDAPGSLDSCVWALGEGAPDPGFDDPDAADPDERGEWDGNAFTDAVLVSSPPPEGTVGYACSAQVVVPRDGADEYLDLSLIGSDQVPPSLQVRHSWTAPGAEPGVLATATNLRADHLAAGEPAPIPGPEPAPQSAADLIPEILEPSVAEAGDEFGLEVNCFADGEVRRLVLPEGSSLVGDGWDNGTSSVVAIDDATAFLADIAEQVQGDDADPPGETTLDDGTTLLLYSHGVPGAGSCGVAVSPDQRYGLVLRYVG